MQTAKHFSGANHPKPTVPFVALLFFIMLVFMTGGSSWPHEWQLLILRPISCLFLGLALCTMAQTHWREHKTIWVLSSLTVFLIAVHLVPLPYSIWTQLPGRELIAQIDDAMGFGKIARPFSMQPDATLNSLVTLVTPLTALLLASQLKDIELQRMFGVLLALILISGLIGVFQSIGAPIHFYETHSDASGLFNNRNHQAAMLAMLFPLAAMLWSNGLGWGFRRSAEKFTALAIAISAVPLLIVTGSRSGLILAVVAIGSAGFLLPYRGKRSHSRAWLALIIMLGLVGTMTWLTVYAERDIAIERLSTSSEDLRYHVWASLRPMIEAYMPWGTGIGTYAAAYQIMEPADLLRPTYSNHAHNEWLEIALTAGLPGLLIVAASGFVLGLSAIRVWPRDDDAAILAKTSAILILILVLASFTDYPARTPIMLVILSLTAIALSKGTQEPIDQSGQNSGPKRHGEHL